MAVTPSGDTSGAGSAVPAQVPSRTTGQPAKVTPGKTGTNLDPVKGN